MTSHTILGVRIDDIGIDDMQKLFSLWLQGKDQYVVVTPNPEFVMLAQRDHEFRMLLNSADLALPDGTGLRFAVSALTEHRLMHRITGVAALQILKDVCTSTGKRIVTLGGGTADVDAGPVTDSLTADVVERIRGMQPDVIAVGLGHGKQERIIARYREAWPSAKILIGVGGAIDMLSGTQRRAPRFLQRIGLEWLWRLLCEPRRLRRILCAFPGFPLLVVWTTLKELRFLQACRRTIPEIISQIFRS